MISVGAFPDTGDLNPDYLVASGTTVTAVATAVEEMLCHTNRGQPDDNVTHVNRRPDFSWKLEYVPRGGVKVDVTQGQLVPPSSCLDPTFMAKRGTWRLTFWLTDQPTFTKTITVEAADPDEWVSIGPDGRVEDSPGFTGRVNAFAIDRHSPGLVYAATPPGGIFRSDGDGDFWYPMSDHKIVDGASKEWQAGLQTGRVVVLPNSHIVASTCDPISNQGCDQDHLFYRSTDGGVTWTQGGTGCVDPNEPDVPFGTVTELVAAPRRGTLFALVRGAVYRSHSEGNCWRRINPPAGLLGTLGLAGLAVQELASPHGLPFTETLYVAASAPGDTTNERTLNQILFVTTDPESPAPTWVAAQLSPSGQPAINVAGTSSIDGVLLAASADAVYAAVALPSSISVYRARTASGGVMPIWERTKMDPPVTPGGNLNFALAVNEVRQPGIDPGNEVAVAATLGVARSVDGGDTWFRLGELHEDHHYLGFAHSGDRLWDASDAGLASIDLPGASAVVSTSWSARNLGLNITQAFSSAMSSADPEHAVTGVSLQDVANFVRKRRGRVWDKVSGCDGLQLTFDAEDPTIAYEGPLNCGRGFFRLALSNNDELAFGNVPFFRADTYKRGRVLAINPARIAQYQLFIGDGLDTLSAPPVNWRCADPQPTLATEFVTATLQFPSNHDLYYVGNSAGDIYTTDASRIQGNASCGAGDTAGQPVYTTQPSPKAKIYAMAADPADRASIYVTQGRTDAQRVVHLVYDPQANAWTPTPLAQNFPLTPSGSGLAIWSTGFVGPIAVDPFSPSTLLVGSEVGIYSGTPTPNASWRSVLSVPNTWVTAIMTVQGPHCDGKGIVRAATFGRSVWERFFPSASTILCLPPPRRSPPPWAWARPDGGEGWTDPASRVHLQVDYTLLEKNAGAFALRVAVLRTGEVAHEVRPANAELTARHGTKIVELFFTGDGPEVFMTDSVKLDLLGRNGEVVASSTQPLPLQFRADPRRVLRLTTSLTGEGGSPLRDVEVALGTMRIRSPQSIALPRGAHVVLSAPESIVAAGRRRATFEGWVGSSRKFSDWTHQRPLPGNPSVPRIDLSMEDDTTIQLTYRPLVEDSAHK